MNLTTSVETANPPASSLEEEEEDAYDPLVVRDDNGEPMNLEGVLSPYNQEKVTSLQGLYGIIPFLEMFHDPRRPEMTGRRKMDAQLNNPEKISQLFKAIGEKEGIEEIIEYADMYYDGIRTGQIIDYGLGLLEKHGLLDRYAKPTKDQKLAAQLSLGRGGEQLNEEEKELYTKAFNARDYYQNMPFPNADNFSASMMTLSSLAYSNSATRKQFSGLEKVIKGKEVKAARKDVYDMPVSTQYAPNVKMP